MTGYFSHVAQVPEIIDIQSLEHAKDPSGKFCKHQKQYNWSGSGPPLYSLTNKFIIKAPVVGWWINVSILYLFPRFYHARDLIRKVAFIRSESQRSYLATTPWVTPQHP